MPALQPAIDIFLQRLAEFASEYTGLEEDVANAQAFVTSKQARQAEVRAEVDKLAEAARVLGFDLFEENQKRWDRSQEHAARQTPPEPEPSRQILPPLQPAPGKFKVKDWILEAAKEAYPRPVRASDLRDRLRAMGHDIHEKTVGMTLYRWTKTGAIKRDRLDWSFVPEEHREPVQAILEGLE